MRLLFYLIGKCLCSNEFDMILNRQLCSYLIVKYSCINEFHSEGGRGKC